MPLYIVRNDITKIKADAIVTAANPHALVGGGVDRAIHAAAGPGLLRAREEIGDIATGDAAVTSAFFLPARYVIQNSSRAAMRNPCGLPWSAAAPPSPSH